MEKSIDNNNYYYNPNQEIKILIVGDMATGKTSVIKRYTDDVFELTNAATIVVNFKTKIMKINGIQYNIHFWDIPGQDRNAVVTGTFARDAQGIIYCCEANKEETRKNLKKWEEALKSKEKIDNISKIIIENKCDMLGDKSKYNENTDNLKLISNELGCLNFFRTSAKEGYNINDAINYLINEIIKNIKIADIENYNNNNYNNNPNKLLKKQNHKGNNKNKKCC